MNDAAPECQAVTFIRDGFQDASQVHMAGTWTLLPSETADLSPEDQMAELGAVYFQPGIAEGAVPAEAVGSGPGKDQLITVGEAAGLLNRTEGHVRDLIHSGRLPVARRAGSGSRAPFLLSLRTVFGLARNPERLAQLLGEAADGRQFIQSHFDALRDRQPADSTRGYDSPAAEVIPMPYADEGAFRG